MTRRLILLTAAAGLILPAQAPPPPPPPYKPTAEERQQIQTKMQELRSSLAAVKGADAALLADVEVYHKAADWILRHGEFHKKEYLAGTLAALETGLARARELKGGKPSWPAKKGRLVRAYRSAVDGSAQPYGMVIPDSYDGSRPMRLDVVLHGRGATLNEVSFITAHDDPKPAPADQDFLQLDVFGRTNNAYRWSGETDVFEALASVQARYKVDPDRIVLRGFSMGGAGTWHIGLHHPDRWMALEAGAGFSETKRYAKKPDLPPHQEAPLHIYDAADYALNAYNVPTVGYGGEDDPQLQAAVNVREQLTREGFRFSPSGLNFTTTDLRALFLVGPKTGHKFHPDSKKQSEEFIRLFDGRRTPDHLRFVTYTTRYNRCFWITVEALGRHYDRAEVDARRSESRDTVTLKTTNVERLALRDVTPKQRISIDGQAFQGGSSPEMILEKSAGRWGQAKAAAPGLRKAHGLQGPIDDAFMESFLLVRPTGTPLHPAPHDYARRSLDRFTAEFDKWLRGEARVKDDQAVTRDDIANHNLVLFGDPSSNRILARIAAKLPIRWTKEAITAGDRTFDASRHTLVMIYPNPLNPRRYVVLNSGHTFHEPEFRGTNALLFPRLGDYAVIEAASEATALAGLFGERWELAPR